MRAFAAALVVASLTSCLELEERISIRADGSGTQSVRFGMTDRGMTIARSFAREASAGFANLADVFNATLVRRELTAAGLSCRKIKTYDRRQSQFVEVEASFPDLRSLRRSPLCGPEAEWRFEPGRRKGTVRLVLFPRGEAAWRESWNQARRIGAEPREEEQQYFDRAKQEMDGLTVTWLLDLPADVVAHSKNLSKTGARQVSAVVTGAGIRTPQDLVRQLAPRYEVVFDGAACTFDLELPAREQR